MVLVSAFLLCLCGGDDEVFYSEIPLRQTHNQRPFPRNHIFFGRRVERRELANTLLSWKCYWLKPTLLCPFSYILVSDILSCSPRTSNRVSGHPDTPKRSSALIRFSIAPVINRYAVTLYNGERVYLVNGDVREVEGDKSAVPCSLYLSDF
jgi:hypothetical protein